MSGGAEEKLLGSNLQITEARAIIKKIPVKWLQAIVSWINNNNVKFLCPCYSRSQPDRWGGRPCSRL